MMTSFDNNEDKICLFLKDDIGEWWIRSHIKSHNLGSRDHGVIIIVLTIIKNKNYP